MPENLSPEIKPAAPKTADDIVDLFKTLDSEPEGEEEVKKKAPPAKEKDNEVEDEEDEDSGDEEDDIELEDPDDEIKELDLDKEEDVEIDAPPRKKAILKDYPDLFKKHPFLEKMLYRDKAYTELFGSFDDAKEIAEKAEVFTNFETQLLSGNTEEVLKNVKETDSKAFDKIVDNYLVVLAKVDKDAYFDVVNNVTKKLIKEMVKEANDKDIDSLREAALALNQFMGWGNNYTEPKPRSASSGDERVKEVEQERFAIVQERFEGARDDLQTKVDNILKSTIGNYIDPKGVMSGYVKKNAISDALKYLSSDVGGDTTFRANLDRLWKSAFDQKFSKASLDKIQSFYLGRSKQGLKKAIIKARTEALKDLAPRASHEKEEKEEERTPRRGIIAPGRPSQPKGKNEMKKGESVAEFFARD
jgi:hypothetical protein